MAYGSALVDTIQSSTAGTPPQFNDGGGTQIGTLCRAWVEFSAATPTKNASFNVSSITKNGTGDFTLTFASAFSDAYYATVMMSRGAQNYYQSDSAQTTTTVRVKVADGSGTAYDAALNSVAVFR